jgi:hypothetical protein
LSIDKTIFIVKFFDFANIKVIILDVLKNLFLHYVLFYMIKYIPRQNSKSPCPMSPNITPNRNGKVIIVNKPGLTSLNRGTPNSVNYLLECPSELINFKVCWRNSLGGRLLDLTNWHLISLSTNVS